MKVLTNQCPICRKSFSNIQGARQHVRRSRGGHCPVKAGGTLTHLYEVKPLRIVRCPFCEVHFPDLESYYEHLLACEREYVSCCDSSFAVNDSSDSSPSN